MVRLLILGFQVAAFAAVVLLAAQIPLKKDIKGRITTVSDYVAEFTSKDFIQAPIRWAGSKFDFIAGHGQKAVQKKNREAIANISSEHAIMERAELSGLLKSAGKKIAKPHLDREDSLDEDEASNED